MANKEHLKILKRGIGVWNKWRERNPEINPDLSDVVLSGQAHRNETKKVMGYIGESYIGANFSRTDLSGSDLTYAYLNGADLKHANLEFSNLDSAYLDEADLTSAQIGWTTFVDNDLSNTIGLDTVKHSGPSSIGIDTLYMSDGKIPETFLRGAGIPDEFITFMPSLAGATQAVQFYSCFISYSTKDEEFARRLYSRMRDEHLRVWFAPEDIKGGEKLFEQIERAIQFYDRLLLVLSEHSMQSEWVMTEIRNARRVETEEKRRKLFPIRLMDFEAIRKWKCFDAETGKDLAVEVREYFIPDFSNWKDHDAFEFAFKRLLRDLKAEETRRSRA